MGKFLLLAVCMVLLTACGTNATRFYPTKQQVKFMNETRWVPQRLLGQVSPLDADESDSEIRYFAQHQTAGASDQGYFGFIATMDVYSFNLSPEQYTVGSVTLSDEGDGEASSLNLVQIGWEVSPRMYGDSCTRLGGLWTTDGYQRTGCPNVECGFQPEEGAPIALGGVIGAVCQPNGLKQSITVKIIKDGIMGDWLVYYALNQDAPALIGCFPRSLFAGGMKDRATSIRFGGYVETHTTNLAPMGSGYLPTGDAMASASMSNIQFINQYGRASLVMQELPTIISNSDIYGVTPIDNGQFFFGGPLQPM